MFGGDGGGGGFGGGNQSGVDVVHVDQFCRGVVNEEQAMFKTSGWSRTQKQKQKMEKNTLQLVT